jgi:antitoxin CptB
MSNTAWLQWRCRRGTLELDLLMMRFLKEVYPSASADQQQAFQRLLDFSDDLLQDLLTGRMEANDKELADVVQQIRNPGIDSS